MDFWIESHSKQCLLQKSNQSRYHSYSQVFLLNIALEMESIMEYILFLIRRVYQITKALFFKSKRLFIFYLAWLRDIYKWLRFKYIREASPLKLTKHCTYWLIQQIPRPLTTKNVCMICRERYVDYLEVNLL